MLHLLLFQEWFRDENENTFTFAHLPVTALLQFVAGDFRLVEPVALDLAARCVGKRRILPVTGG